MNLNLSINAGTSLASAPTPSQEQPAQGLAGIVGKLDAFMPQGGATGAKPRLIDDDWCGTVPRKFPFPPPPPPLQGQGGAVQPMMGTQVGSEG